jgi:pilus assembly protein TadC
MKNNILVIIWSVLAIISFVSSFWAPLFFKIIGIAFGAVNIFVIIAWIVSIYMFKKSKEEDVQL